MTSGQQRLDFPHIMLIALCLSPFVVALPLQTGMTRAEVIDRQVLGDAEIEAGLEARFSRDEVLMADFLDVDVEDGVVTLAGTVRTLREHDRALAVAKALRGVRAVVDRVRVQPVSRPDAAIAADVEAALEADAATDAYEVEVRVRDGVVTLSGSVEGWAERELTVQVAKDVQGVKDVRSELAIVFPRHRSDREIRADIEARLRADTWLFDDPLRVEVQNGHVVLSGTVGSAAEKARARHLAGVAGVRDVEAQEVSVDWLLRDPVERKTPAFPRTDEQVRQAVKDALRHDPRVAAEDIRVGVDDGVVTMTGTAGDLRAKQAVEADAINTIGVWHVRNFVKVKPSKPTTVQDGEATAARIRQALDRSPFLHDRQIQVSVRDGRAVLKGSVASSFEKARAEELASGVKGVVSVSNQLEFAEPDPSTHPEADRELWRAIHQELWWTPSLYDERITVDVNQGVVTLRGTVETIHERRLATQQAYAAGATHVRNRLRVEYAPDFFTASAESVTAHPDS